MRAAVRHLGSALLLASLLGLGPCPAWADFKQDYLKAQDAMKGGAWAEAATLLRRALGEQAQESARVKFYGTFLGPYVPHFLLGGALVKLGQCDEALRELDESERQGVIQGLGAEYGRLKSYRDQCRTTAAPPTSPPTAPPTSPPARPPTPTLAAVLALPPTPTPPRGPEPRLLREAQQRAQSAIAEASRSEELVKGLRRKPELQAVWDQRGDLARRLEAAAATLERARSLQGRQTAEELDSAATLATQARKELESLKEQLGIASRDLEQALARSVPTAPATPPPLPPAATRPHGGGAPAELRSAVAAFLRADYRRTVDDLARVDYAQPRAVAVGLLFRSAARYLLFLEGGQKDAALKEAAAADLRAMHAKDPQVTLQPEVFSPAFIQFFSDVR